MKLEMKHTVNTVVELKTELPCAAINEDKSLCSEMAIMSLGTMNEHGFWEIVPLCNDCWEQVKPDLVTD